MMKKILILLFLFAGVRATAQVKISQMPTFIGDPTGGYVPIVISGVNRKIDAKYFGKDTTGHWLNNVYARGDSLFKWQNGAEVFINIAKDSNLIRTIVGDSVALKLNKSDSTIYASIYQNSLKFTLPSLKSGSILFSNGTTIAQDSNFLSYNTTDKTIYLGYNTQYSSAYGLTVSPPIANAQTAIRVITFPLEGNVLTMGSGSNSVGSKIQASSFNTGFILPLEVDGLPLLLNPSGNDVGIGFTVTKFPSARLHIIAGQSAAGKASFKIDPGVNLTTPEVGAIENDSTTNHLYWTDKSGIRYALDQQTVGYAPLSKLAIPNNQIVFGNDTSLSSSSKFTVDTTNSALKFNEWMIPMGGSIIDPSFYNVLNYQGTGGIQLGDPNGGPLNFVTGRNGKVSFNRGGVTTTDLYIDSLGNILFGNLQTGSTAPTQTGSIKMLTTDGAGKVSFTTLLPTGTTAITPALADSSNAIETSAGVKQQIAANTDTLTAIGSLHVKYGTKVDTLYSDTASATKDGITLKSDWSNFNGKQAALVSQSNIKSIDSLSILGSGDLGTKGDMLRLVQELGSNIVAVSVGSQGSFNAVNNMVSATLNLNDFLLKNAATIHGITFSFGGNVPNFTASGYNGVGLYTVNANGTYTLVASTTSDTTMFHHSNTDLSVNFSSAYSAAAGVYAIGFLYQSSSETLAPQLYRGISMGRGSIGAALPNSLKLFSTITAQTTLPASFAASTTAGVNASLFFTVF